MESVTTNPSLMSLILIARMNHMRLDVEELRHRFAIGNEPVRDKELLRLAKGVGLKAKKGKCRYDQLGMYPLPMLVDLKEDGFVILAKLSDKKALILDPQTQNPVYLEKEEFEKKWSGAFLLIKHKEYQKQRIKFGLKWFWPSIVKYKSSFIDVLLASLTLQVIGLISPLIIQVVIDKVLVHKGFSTLRVLMIGLLVIVTFEMTMGLAKNYVFTHTTNRIDVILSARLFDHLMKLPLRYFEVRRVGETIARVREVENIRRFITGAPLSSLLDVFFLALYLIVMFLYSSTLTLVVLASLPFFVILSLAITPVFKMHLKEKFKHGAEMQSFLVEAVSGVQTVKSFSLEPLTQKRWEDRIADYVNASFKTSITAGTASTLGKYIQRISDLVLLWMGTHLVISQQLTVGQLIAFRMLSSRVSSPILRLVNLWQEFQQASVSIERLGDIFDAQPEPCTEETKLRLPPVKGTIAFKDVTFRYRANTTEAVRNLSFQIPAGKRIGIVGRSGSGKSTLSKLVQRLYIPESGKIMVDGVDLSMADPHWLRRQMGVVLQENFLFNGTVRENICIHEPSASMERIVGCARMAGAHEFILELPEGYDTSVGEKGTALSGGQRQRIAIARALLMNPRILIFDEATSALDYESEKKIQENITQICQGRTVLMIAHRMSTIQDCDAIMVLEKGKLAEFGSHDQLMKRPGSLYRYLFMQQRRSGNQHQNDMEEVSQNAYEETIERREVL